MKPPPKAWVYGLTIAIWISSALFGSFALLHYIRGYISLTCTDTIDDGTKTCTQSAWDRTDPNLYRPSHRLANRVMVTHLVGGVFLMTAGPFQLLKCIRQRWMWLHRWVGRIYIFAAVLASSCAVIWTLVWRTSRCNIHEDIGNVIFGLAVFVSAVQTFRYIAFEGTRNVEWHKLWAWRLYACVLGAPLYRLYNTIYGALVLYTPLEGSIFIENAIFYTPVIPGLIVVQILWQRNAQQERQINAESAMKEDLERSSGRTKQSPQLVEPLWIQTSLLFVVVTTLIIVPVLWLPAILGQDPGVAEDIYHDFCAGQS